MKAKPGLTKDGALIAFPGYRDREFLLEYAIGVVVRLTASRDREVAFEAAKWLAEYGERLRQTIPAEEGGAPVIAEAVLAIQRPQTGRAKSSEARCARCDRTVPD